VRKIELELEGVKTVARLLDDHAPKACQALWEALPFEDDVTHGRWSGGRLHTHNHPKLAVDDGVVENPSVFQAPGDIVLAPSTNELMVVYAPGNFRPYLEVTAANHVGRIDGDFSAFARKVERLQWEGAKHLVVRQAPADAAENPKAPVIGPTIMLNADGKEWVFELFADKAPKLCQAILDALPLEGPATNTHSTGMIIHYWVDVPNVPEEVETGRERKRVDDRSGNPIGHTAVAFYDPREMRAFNPGDLFFCADEGFLLLHGQGQFGPIIGKGSGRVGQAATQKVGRIVSGSVEELHALGDKIEWEGAATMRLSRSE
jgi:hypothetical protein